MDGIGYLGIFVALVGLVGGLWSLRGHRRSRAQSAAAAHWRTAPGKVLETGIATKSGRSGNVNYVHYHPWSRYSYAVGGKEWVGERVRFGMVTVGNRGAAEKILAPYPAGADVTVHYDPDAPGESVLEPGVLSNNLRNAAILCVFVFLLGAAIVVASMGGLLSADVDGHWRVSFQADGAQYEGTLEASHRAGPLTLDFTDSQGPRRVREQCTLTRHGQNVAVRCRDPEALAGGGSYSPDDFDLTYQGGSTLVGSVSSHGAVVGSATFTR